ncbi:MAG: magnesium transporter [Acidobacteriota bacterium]
MRVVTVKSPEQQGELLRKFVRKGSRASITKLLGKVRSEDVAVAFRGLTPAERVEVFRMLALDFPESAADVLAELDSPLRLSLLERLEPNEVASLLDRMPVDDQVFVIESLPEELQPAVLELMGVEHLSDVQGQLTFEEDTAGRIMTREYFALPETTTVREAVAAIQEHRELELIVYLYVLDTEGRLVGVMSLRQLLLARPSKTLGEVMTRDVITVHTDTDQEEVAQLATRYDLLAIPVVDSDQALMGIVTYDDIVDVVREEATEDFYKLAGTSDEEIVYQERSFKVAWIRFPWLLVNLAGGVLTGLLLEHFQVRLEEALFLLTFVPVIMGMGGNVGTQTSTIAVRGLATGRIRLGEGSTRQFLWRQLKVGVLLGIACATVVAVAAAVLQQNPMYSAVVGCAMMIALVLASLNGATIPILFERLGVDPAIASGPLVTTSNDITGILIYFGLASALIELLVR